MDGISPPPPAPPSPPSHGHQSSQVQSRGQLRGFTTVVYQPPSLLDVDSANLLPVDVS